MRASVLESGPPLGAGSCFSLGRVPGLVGWARLSKPCTRRVARRPRVKQKSWVLCSPLKHLGHGRGLWPWDFYFLFFALARRGDGDGVADSGV